MSVELSPHEIEAVRLRIQVDRLIARDKRAYNEQFAKYDAWLLAEPVPSNKRKRRDSRGSKKGVRRGPYKKYIR